VVKVNRKFEPDSLCPVPSRNERQEVQEERVGAST
jgi:hypothetical protein